MPLPVPLDLLALARDVPPPQRHYFVEFGSGMFHVKQLRRGPLGTLAEITFLARWLGGHPEVASILLVSSASHLRRVRMCCRALLREGLQVKLAAVPEDPHVPGAGASAEKEPAGSVLKELLKLPVYWIVLRGRRR